jgi:hypothetical protein
MVSMGGFSILTNRKRAIVALVHSFVFLLIAVRQMVAASPASGDLAFHAGIYVRAFMLISAVLVGVLIARRHSSTNAKLPEGGLQSLRETGEPNLSTFLQPQPLRLTYDFSVVATVDPERDLQFLREQFSRMTEDELLQAARDADSLTDSARGVVADELRGRGVTPPGPPGWDEWEAQRWTAVAQFRDLPEALLAKGSLESAATECYLLDDNVVRLDWLWSNLIGGVKLLVRPEEEQSAREMLSQPIPERIEVPGVGDYEQPRCPKCESLDVTFQELDRPVAYVSAYFNFPIPLQRHAWRCHSCYSQWEDDATDVNDTGTNS